MEKMFHVKHNIERRATMAYNHEYPYFDASDQNVDWFLNFVAQVKREWAEMKEDWNNVLTEWDGMKNTWEEYRQELENRFGEFTTNITNQFGALRLEFNNLSQEFTALKTYVETQINNLPDEVKNIFQSYIDNGTIQDMIKDLIPDVPEDLKAQVEKNKNDISGLTTSLATLTNTVEGHTTSIANLTTKVNQNTTDITSNAVNIAKNTTDIGNNKINIQTLTTTVTSHTTEITNIKTEQTEIMNDIADINELDVQQNNRLTALEARPIGDNSEYIWFIVSENLSNLATMLSSQIGTSFVEVLKTSTTFDNFPTILDTTKPSKKPTRIVVICSYARTTGALSSLNQQLAVLAEKAQSKYKGVHTYYVAPPSPINTCGMIQLMSAVVNTNGYSAANRSPFFHLVMNPTLVAYPNTEKNSNGDFETTNSYRGFLYVRSLYDSIFCMGDVGFHMKYKVPLFSEMGVDFDSASITVELSPNYITYTIAIYVKGRSNNSFDFPGSNAYTIATVQSTQSIFILLDMTFLGTVTFFHRDNRSSGGHTANIKVLRQTSNNTVNIDVSNLDYDGSSILTGFTLYGSFSMPWRTEADPIN